MRKKDVTDVRQKIPEDDMDDSMNWGQKRILSTIRDFRTYIKKLRNQSDEPPLSKDATI